MLWFQGRISYFMSLFTTAQRLLIKQSISQSEVAQPLCHMPPRKGCWENSGLFATVIEASEYQWDTHTKTWLQGFNKQHFRPFISTLESLSSGWFNICLQLGLSASIWCNNNHNLWPVHLFPSRGPIKTLRYGLFHPATNFSTSSSAKGRLANWGML